MNQTIDAAKDSTVQRADAFTCQLLHVEFQDVTNHATLKKTVNASTAALDDNSAHNVQYFPTQLDEAHKEQYAPGMPSQFVIQIWQTVTNGIRQFS